jgi:hypothetical protein
MSSFKVDKLPDFPHLEEFEQVNFYGRAESDTMSYFSAWDQPWGTNVSQSIYLYKPKTNSQAYDLSLFYVIVCVISEIQLDDKATKDYIAHQENLCYPLPWKFNVNGRAKFEGASFDYEQKSTKLVFSITDPDCS